MVSGGCFAGHIRLDYLPDAQQLGKFRSLVYLSENNVKSVARHVSGDVFLFCSHQHAAAFSEHSSKISEACSTPTAVQALHQDTNSYGQLSGMLQYNRLSGCLQ